MYFSPCDCSDCFVVIFFSFYFLNALQNDNNSNRVYVLGHKYVLGPSQTHESKSGPKHIYAREHKLYCYIN